jgi:exodeoxyribonuclease-3
MTQTLRIVTWNINSLRLRLGLLPGLIAAMSPDIICLQETKVPDELFPMDAMPGLGFPHVLRTGMKGYNGTAILSRLPLEPMADMPNWCAKGDCRHIAGVVQGAGGPVVIHNFYVPAGGDVPDREANPKYGHKLDFIAEARTWFRTNPPTRTVLVGDLNIAPLDNDVWSHKQLLDVVSHTPAETEGLLGWQSEGFMDAIRHFVPADRKLYTWWSYRNRDWRGSDRGRRLDHVWLTADLTPLRHDILKDARDWTQTSDHVPVLVEFSV